MTLVITPAGDLQWSVIDSETGTIVAPFISRGRARRFVDGQPARAAPMIRKRRLRLSRAGGEVLRPRARSRRV
ncbi:hypothetical protein SAMN05444161_7521 [Rhizobiales bacterium GAS191]|nr:hypothetical protein SAMN05444161_7521 [Rhizobiales bacterium GAS191]